MGCFGIYACFIHLDQHTVRKPRIYSRWLGMLIELASIYVRVSFVGNQACCGKDDVNKPNFASRGCAAGWFLSSLTCMLLTFRSHLC